MMVLRGSQRLVWVVLSPSAEGGVFSLVEITVEEALKRIAHLHRLLALVCNAVLRCHAVCTPTD